jgi:hypothetical protein
MSLTQHLYRPGPLRSWWQAHSAGLAGLTEQLSRYAYPVRPLARTGAQHAAAVGGIVGRRVETMVELAPPYAALMAGGFREDACDWPTHKPLETTEHEQAAAEWRPTPGGWRHLVPATDQGTWSQALWAIAETEVNSRDERELARAAGAVTALESAYRSGGPVVEVEDAAVADAVAIVGGLSRCRAWLADMCGGQIRGHAAPSFIPHWADGDLLVGPGRSGGYGLLDVKTVGAQTLSSQERTLSWLWQILSYAVADEDADTWRIRAVGILLPRQDDVVAWSLDEVWRAADIRPADRAQLADLLEAAYDGDLFASLNQGQAG